MVPQAFPSPQGCGEQVLEGGISTVGTMLERYPFGTLQLAGGAFTQIYQDMVWAWRMYWPMFDTMIAHREFNPCLGNY